MGIFANGANASCVCDCVAAASCETVECHQNAHCTNISDGPVCVCKYGYEGNASSCQRKYETVQSYLVYLCIAFLFDLSPVTDKIKN